MKTTWDKDKIQQIKEKARTGHNIVSGFGSKKALPSFDDLTFLPAGLSRMVIDAHKEHCNTRTILGAKSAKNPIVLETPIMIAPMSYGAVSKEVKLAFAKASTLAGTACNTGEGGMLPEEREQARHLIYQCTPGRYGFNPTDLQRADALEFYVSQGSKPGSGGHLQSKKITAEIALARGLPVGIDLRSPSRHPDWMGADDLVLKVLEFREATEWQVPISIKIGAGRVKEDIKIAIKVGADMIAIDGMQAGTGAAPQIMLDHIGIPTMAALTQAVQGLREENKEDEIDIVIMGGITDGADAAKALALGAKAVAIGSASLIALGCKVCRRCTDNECPEGICTQNPELRKRFDVEVGAQRLANLIQAMTEEIKVFTRCAGKTDVHNLEPEDMRALTLEVSAITGIPLVGSDFVFQWPPSNSK